MVEHAEPDGDGQIYEEPEAIGNGVVVHPTHVGPPPLGDQHWADEYDREDAPEEVAVEQLGSGSNACDDAQQDEHPDQGGHEHHDAEAPGDVSWLERWVRWLTAHGSALLWWELASDTGGLSRPPAGHTDHRLAGD